MKLFHVQDDDRPMWVLAEDYAHAVERWMQRVRQENDDDDQPPPDGVRLIATNHFDALPEILLPGSEPEPGPSPEQEGYIDIVFDGPPGPESGRFVEAENPENVGRRVGAWIDRKNGLWALRIPIKHQPEQERDRREADRRADPHDIRMQRDHLRTSVARLQSYLKESDAKIARLKAENRRVAEIERIADDRADRIKTLEAEVERMKEGTAYLEGLAEGRDSRIDALVAEVESLSLKLGRLRHAAHEVAGRLRAEIVPPSYTLAAKLDRIAAGEAGEGSDG